MKKLGILVLILMTFLLIASVSAISMTKTVPSTASPGSTFTVIYTVSGATGGWGASIIDNATGGCKFPGGATQLKTVMLSVDGTTKSVTVTAPSSSGSCIFTGDVKFGTDAIVNFLTATTTIGICASNCAGKECGDNGCGGSCGTCSSGTCSNGQCVTTCPYGQIRCSDGLCKATCGTSGGISNIWIIFIVVIVGIGIFWLIFRQKSH